MPRKPFRVEVTGRDHPHKGARGTCDPETAKRVGGVLMAEVRFDLTEARGADGCFATADEMRELPDPDNQEAM